MATSKELLELTHVDISKMSRSELAKAVDQIGAIVNKRIKRLESTERGRESPALRKIQKSGGKITTKGKTQGQLQGEFARARNFIQLQTSTLKGVSSVVKKREKIMGKGFDNIEDERKFWSEYRKLESQHRATIFSYGSDNAIKLLRKEVDAQGGDIDEAANTTSEKMDNIYESLQMADLDED